MTYNVIFFTADVKSRRDDHKGNAELGTRSAEPARKGRDDHNDKGGNRERGTGNGKGRGTRNSEPTTGGQALELETFVGPHRRR